MSLSKLPNYVISKWKHCGCLNKGGLQCDTEGNKSLTENLYFKRFFEGSCPFNINDLNEF